jgi:hypothetical protein
VLTLLLCAVAAGSRHPQAEQRCKAKEAENQELMGMCDQLLQQQEAKR